MQIPQQAIEGGEQVQLTKQGGIEAFESYDSQNVYHTKSYDDPMGLWRVPVDGAREELISDEVREGNWGLYGNSAYYLNRNES
jgi:hypothetical protein